MVSPFLHLFQACPKNSHLKKLPIQSNINHHPAFIDAIASRINELDG